MKYSLTQGGNLGQMISFVLLLIGFGGGDPSQADAGANAILLVISIGAYVVSFIVSWIGRYRQGGVTLGGWKKPGR